MSTVQVIWILVGIASPPGKENNLVGYAEWRVISASSVDNCIADDPFIATEGKQVKTCVKIGDTFYAPGYPIKVPPR